MAAQSGRQGQWERARFFPRAGEDMHGAVARECQAVRSSVGVFDATTLGKIEVVGPDAAAFLDRLYVNQLGSLPVGRCRYAIMLSEAGFVMDDGIVARLYEDVRALRIYEGASDVQRLLIARQLLSD